MPELSPRAQEILAAVERDVEARRAVSAAPPAAPVLAPPPPSRHAPPPPRPVLPPPAHVAAPAQPEPQPIDPTRLLALAEDVAIQVATLQRRAAALEAVVEAWERALSPAASG